MNHKLIASSVQTGIIRSLNKVDETLIFPVRYCDLTLKSFIALELYDVNDEPEMTKYLQRDNEIRNSNIRNEQKVLGSTVIELFTPRKTIRQGRHSLYIWKGVKPDVQNIIRSKTSGLLENDKQLQEMNYLLQRIDEYNLHKVRSISWLDRLSKPAIEQKQADILLKCDQKAYLEVNFPMFLHPIVYIEEVYNSSLNNFIWPNKVAMSGKLNHPSPTPSNSTSSSTIQGIVRVYDSAVMRKNWKVTQQNPIVQKYYTLTRQLPDSLARQLKPNEEQKTAIKEILSEPDILTLNDAQKFILWKYRYTLLNDFPEDALPKFLKSVSWIKEKEEKQAMSMLQKWPELNNIQNVLPLLSSYFSANNFYNKKVVNFQTYAQIRKFAVRCLHKATNDQIESILLQLVQAYRYEDFSQSMLKNFLINRSVKDYSLLNGLFWYLNVQRDGDTKDQIVQEYQYFYNELMQTILSYNEKGQEIDITQAPGKNKLKESLLKQQQFRIKIRRLGEYLKKTAKKADKISVALKKIVGSTGSEFCLLKNDKVLMPVKPTYYVNSVIPEKCTCFKSAKIPLLLNFKVTPSNFGQHQDSINMSSMDSFGQKQRNPTFYQAGLQPPFAGKTYGVIFKYGDDLRQDQLVLQMIRFMDYLLRSVNVDLQFTPYLTLATTKDDGFVEFIPHSQTIQYILQKNNDKIGKYLKKCAQEIANTPHAVSSEKMQETFIRSCAGYCAVTYILGVGDRHLENLLIDRYGHLFHIDFGFIFGKNPAGKILGPPIRICKQMVEAMGGNQSPGYQKFEQLCVQAFLYLRDHSKYLINLLHLMIHAGIKDLADNPEMRLQRVYQKFMPYKTRQEAETQFKQIINQSVTALFPIFMEKMHRWALAFK